MGWVSLAVDADCQPFAVNWAESGKIEAAQTRLLMGSLDRIWDVQQPTENCQSPFINRKRLTVLCQPFSMKKPKTEITERETMILVELAKRDMTPADLAKSIGRGITTIKSWISGDSIPEMTPVETKIICDLMGWSLDDLATHFPGESRRRTAIKNRHEVKREERRAESISEILKKSAQE
jgi:hypothetical protein